MPVILPDTSSGGLLADEAASRPAVRTNSSPRRWSSAFAASTICGCQSCGRASIARSSLLLFSATNSSARSLLILFIAAQQTWMLNASLSLDIFLFVAAVLAQQFRHAHVAVVRRQ